MFAKQAADKIVYDFLVKKADDDDDGLPEQDKGQRKRFWLAMAALGGGAAVIGGGMYLANKYKDTIGNAVAGDPPKDDRSLLKKLDEDYLPLGAASTLGLAAVGPSIHAIRPVPNIPSPAGKGILSSAGRVGANVGNFGLGALGFGSTPESMSGTAKNLLIEKPRAWYDILSKTAPTTDAVNSRNVIPDEGARTKFRTSLANALNEVSSGAQLTPGSKADAIKRLVDQTPITGDLRKGVSQDVRAMDRLKYMLAHPSAASDPLVQKVLELEPQTSKTKQGVTTVTPAQTLSPTAAHEMLKQHGKGGYAPRVARRTAAAIALQLLAGRLGNAVFGRQDN